MAETTVVRVSPQELARARARLVRGHHRLSAQQRKLLSTVTGVKIREAQDVVAEPKDSSEAKVQRRGDVG